MRISSSTLFRTAALLLCFAPAISVGCVSIPKSFVYKRQQFWYDLPEAAGRLTWEETTRICTAAKSLRAEPTVLYVRRGEQIGVLDHLQTVALDSAGQPLGEPRVVDWKLSGRTRASTSRREQCDVSHKT